MYGPNDGPHTTTTRVTTTKLATTNTSRCSRCSNGGSWGSTTMGLSRRVCLKSPGRVFFFLFFSYKLLTVIKILDYVPKRWPSPPSNWPPPTPRCSRCSNGGSWGSTTMGLSRRVCLESPGRVFFFFFFSYKLLTVIKILDYVPKRWPSPPPRGAAGAATEAAGGRRRWGSRDAYVSRAQVEFFSSFFFHINY